MDHLDPYEISGWSQDSFDRVTQQCTFKYGITRDFVDEMVCDVLPMDCIDVLVGIPSAQYLHLYLHEGD